MINFEITNIEESLKERKICNRFQLNECEIESDRYRDKKVLYIYMKTERERKFKV